MKLKYENKIITTTEQELFDDIGDNFDIHLHRLILDFKQYCFLAKEYVNVIKAHLLKRTTIEKDINAYLKYDLLLLKLLKNKHKILLNDIEDDNYCIVEEDNKISCGNTQHINIRIKELLKALDIKIITTEE